MSSKNIIKPDRIVFYGRSLAEYKLFFNLDMSATQGLSVLDCAAGASSFAIEASKLRVNVVAVDKMYSHDVEELKNLGRTDINHVVEKVMQTPHMYVWKYFHNINELRSAREKSLELFYKDFPSGLASGRYISASLPNLPFENSSFDLVLCGHFLFAYQEFLSYDFHLNALRELVRVSRREVRVFPVNGFEGKVYPRLNALLQKLEEEGISSKVLTTNYECIRGMNQLLILQKTKIRIEVKELTIFTALTVPSVLFWICWPIIDLFRFMVE